MLCFSGNSGDGINVNSKAFKKKKKESVSGEEQTPVEWQQKKEQKPGGGSITEGVTAGE